MRFFFSNGGIPWHWQAKIRICSYHCFPVGSTGTRWLSLDELPSALQNNQVSKLNYINTFLIACMCSTSLNRKKSLLSPVKLKKDLIMTKIRGGVMNLKYSRFVLCVLRHVRLMVSAADKSSNAVLL